jgi:16S rRNA (guanine527-N7)-methyltransferase
VDNALFLKALRGGSAKLGVVLDEALEVALSQHFALLRQWNQRVNLTSVVEPEEAAERHFLDSLAILPEVTHGRRLLDLGSGAGFPGVVLKSAQPSLALQAVDAVSKKVAFLKQLIVELGLKEARALHRRLEGSPGAEGVDLADIVTTRAVGSLDLLLPLVRPYLAQQGTLVAMVSGVDEDEVAKSGERAGWELAGLRHYRLPFSGAHRAVAVLRPR